jgi:hypothetical protein
MGNKESVQGDGYDNGAIDVPTGDMGGSYLKGIASSSLMGFATVRVSVERQSVDGMDAGEEYIAYDGPQWAGAAERFLTEVRFSGSPLAVSVYGPAPERDDTFVETDLTATLGIFGLGVEFDRGSYEWVYPESVAAIGGDKWSGENGRFAIRGRADVLPDDLWIELEYESLTHDMDLGATPISYGTGELIGRAGFSFREGWTVVTDVRHVTYEYDLSDPGTTDDSFFDPYLALLWSPRKNIEVRLGYGVNPTTYADSPVEGRGNGRERWRSAYLWDHSAGAVWFPDLMTEEALEDARVVSLMAVIAF